MDEVCSRKRLTDFIVPKSILLLENKFNSGVGYSIKKGYKKSIELGADISVVIAGDAQMDISYLKDLIDPIVEGKADYSKGNRLFSGKAFKEIPKIRYYGNAILSLLTKL